MYEIAQQLLDNQNFFRAGPNKAETFKVKEMLKQGMTIEEISAKLRIKVVSLRSYAPKPEPEDAEVPEGAEAFAGVKKRGSRK